MVGTSSLSLISNSYHKGLQCSRVDFCADKPSSFLYFTFTFLGFDISSVQSGHYDFRLRRSRIYLLLFEEVVDVSYFLASYAN